MNLQSKVKLRSGNTMPILALGTWNLTIDTADTLDQALKLGYPMIDTSGDYGTQPGIGQGLKKNGAPRDSFYLVTKVEETDDAYEKTKQDLHELGLTYADLMLIHRPPKAGFGEQLWQGLIRARDEGLTRDIGVSNYSVKLLKELIDATGEVPAVNQIEWSPFGFSDEMQGYCNDMGIVIQAYSPLTRAERLDDDTLEAMATKHEHTPAQVLLRWAVQRGVVPLPKANKREHYTENLDIFDFVLSNEDMTTLNELNEEWSALGEKPVYLQ